MNEVQTRDPITEMIGEAVPAVHNNLPAIAGQPMPPALPQTPIGRIATAISAVMNEIGVIAKHGRNTFHNYKYAAMQDILQQLTPLLAKHGLLIVQTEVSRAMFDEDRAVSVQYQFTIAHSSGELWPERPLQTGLSRCRDSKGGFDDKALNKCHTAARKYFLLALFQIPTGDEDDADRGHNDGPRRPARPAPNIMSSPPSSGLAPAVDQPAPPLTSPPSTHGGAGQESATDRFARIDRALAAEALKGTAALKAEWDKLGDDDKATLKAALDRRHKRTAFAVDQKMEQTA